VHLVMGRRICEDANGPSAFIGRTLINDGMIHKINLFSYYIIEKACGYAASTEIDVWFISEGKNQADYI